MKGLLIKELCLLKNSMKTQLFMILIFAVLGIFMKNVSYTGMMVTVMGTNMILGTLSYDESSSWNRYAMTLPVRREDLISVKYILMYLLTTVSVLFTALLGIPLSIIADLSLAECLATVAACGAVALFASSMNLMLCTKLGVEKARIIMVLTYMIPFAIVFLLYYLAVEKHMVDVSGVTDRDIALILACAAACIVVLSVLCWRISIGIIRKQDL